LYIFHEKLWIADLENRKEKAEIKVVNDGTNGKI